MSSVRKNQILDEGQIYMKEPAFVSSGPSIERRTSIGIKRKQDEISISNSELPQFHSIKSRRRNVLNLLNDRESGMCPNMKFCPEFSSIKVKQLRETNCFTAAHFDFHSSECKFVRGSADGKSIIALWKGLHYNAIIYRVTFKFRQKSQKCLNIPPLVEGIDQIGPFYALTRIRDMCDAQFRQQNCVLYVGDRFHDMKREGSTVLCNFSNSSYTYGRQYISKSYVLSCAANMNGERFATGTEQGCYIFDDDRCTYKACLPGNVSSVEFNNCGKLLFCGVETSGLTVFDLREPPWNRRTVRVNRFKPVGVLETKLLFDEKSMIVSSVDGTLSKVDFNKNETVLKYEGHVGCDKKIPFSLDEAADILCATGSDNLTRLWSLNSGKLLHTIRPKSITRRSHSWIVTHENQWFVAMFDKDKLFTYEPCVKF